jgi:hypothetical protein
MGHTCCIILHRVEPCALGAYAHTYKECSHRAGVPPVIMLILLTAFYLLHKVLALPIPAIEERTSSPCDDLRNCRTISDIIWSCIVTIFACTWVAIHPNIPRPNSNRHWYSGPLRRARIMFYALVGPEFIILWAWRQRNIASGKSETLQGLFSLTISNSLLMLIFCRLVPRSRFLCRNGRFCLSRR